MLDTGLQAGLGKLAASGQQAAWDRYRSLLDVRAGQAFKHKTGSHRDNLRAGVIYQGVLHRLEEVAGHQKRIAHLFSPSSRRVYLGYILLDLSRTMVHWTGIPCSGPGCPTKIL